MNCIYLIWQRSTIVVSAFQTAETCLPTVKGVHGGWVIHLLHREINKMRGVNRNSGINDYDLYLPWCYKVHEWLNAVVTCIQLLEQCWSFEDLAMLLDESCLMYVLNQNFESLFKKILVLNVIDYFILRVTILCENRFKCHGLYKMYQCIL